MRRKIIQIADSTQLVSIPRAWAKKQGLKKGDEVEVEEKENNLIISLDKKDQIERVSIQIDKVESFLLRFIGALYKSGYDELELSYKNASIFYGVLNKISDYYPGYDIVEQTEKKVIIKDLGHQREASFDVVLRRLFVVTASLITEFKEAFKRGSVIELREILHLEMTNNRFSNFCERLLNKQGHKDYKITFLYNIIWEMEKLVDEYKYLGQYIVKHHEKEGTKMKISKQVLDIIELSDMTFREFYSLFYKFNMDSVNIINLNRKKIIKESKNIMESSKGFDSVIAHHMIIISQMIFNMLGSFLGTVSYKTITK